MDATHTVPGRTPEESNDATSRETSEALCRAVGIDPAKWWGCVNNYLCDAFWAGERVLRTPTAEVRHG